MPAAPTAKSSHLRNNLAAPVRMMNTQPCHRVSFIAAFARLRVNTIKVRSRNHAFVCSKQTGGGEGPRGRAPVGRDAQGTGPVPPCLWRAVKLAVRLASDGWFIISQTQACQLQALRRCAMHTKTDLPTRAKKKKTHSALTLKLFFFCAI